MISSRHLAAREYAAQGIPVFPCVPGTKRPAVENGFHDATTDLAQIDVWWGEADYNLAIPPEAAGWCVGDSDGGPIGEETWAKLQEEHGQAPETYTVRTPSGGLHRYYAGSLPPSVAKLGPKFDTRGRGSYVLVPPSVVDGKPYEVLHDREIAPVPAWIEPTLAMFKQKVVTAVETADLPVNIARAVSWLQSRETVQQGDGADARTYEAAAMLRDLGISPEKSLELMLAHYKCEPQDDRFEPFIARKIESAWAYAQNEPGAWGIAPPADTFAAALDKLGLLGAGEGVQRPDFYPYTLEELEDEPPLEWVVPDLIPRRQWGMLYGPPKTFKTFLALTIILPVCEHEEVVFCAGEGAALVSARARAWRTLTGKPTPGLRIVKKVPLAFDPSSVEALIAAIRAASLKPAVVVIDTAARSMLGLDEQSAKDVGLFVAAMEYIKTSLGCAVLVVHHTGKDASKGARGSSALLGGVDFSAEVQRHERTMAVAIRVRAMKDAAEREAPWTYEGKGFANTLVFQPTTREEHEAGTRGAKAIRPEAVTAALKTLGAVSDDAAVVTHVLATAMVAPCEDETPEQRQEAVEAKARLLAAAARDLAFYVIGEGRARRWRLPL